MSNYSPDRHIDKNIDMSLINYQSKSHERGVNHAERGGLFFVHIQILLEIVYLHLSKIQLSLRDQQ